MRWIGEVSGETDLTVEYNRREVAAFHEAFIEVCPVEREVTKEQAELEIEWAQIHPDAFNGMSGTLDEMLATAGMLRAFGDGTAAVLRISKAEVSNSAVLPTRQDRQKARVRREMRAIAAGMARKMFGVVSEEMEIDSEAFEAEVQAHLLRQPIT